MGFISWLKGRGTSEPSSRIRNLLDQRRLLQTELAGVNAEISTKTPNNILSKKVDYSDIIEPSKRKAVLEKQIADIEKELSRLDPEWEMKFK